MTNTEELYERRKKLVPNALGIFNPSSVRSAKGAIIIDADGRELIDFAGGIGVMNAGHSPEAVVKAIQAQASRFTHVGFNVSIYKEYLDLAEKLVELIPHGEHTKVMLTGSGAESVENSIKIARQATGRSAVICYSGAFHGRTLMAMTLTSNVKYKQQCGPYAPEVYRLDFPYYTENKSEGMSEEEFSDVHIKKLEDFFASYVPAKQVAAIIIELVQGEGGFTVAPKSYIQNLRKICDNHGILLIIDEVQSGFGRTGKWAAFHHYDVFPDLSTWAKSMGGGMPIGAVMGKAEIMDKALPGTIGGTYLGNPVACAASLATIQYMQEERINERGLYVGRMVRNVFEELQITFPDHIKDIRGLGAMLAIEFVQPKSGNPDGEITKRIMLDCLENGLIIITAGTHGNCIRVLSPLVIEDEVLLKGLAILKNSITKIIGNA
ncbi:aspartate aminotransferase family protein [Namhaeicola litoreus]|uniref:Aspartate aminotransferase family protein n=1 Tax=Namhaeicola litoreus TaxID=1052145 RepID=A0ABW3Y508_9FLAO